MKRLLALLLFAASPLWATLTLVQSGQGSSNLNSCTVSLSSAIGSGHLLVLYDALRSSVQTDSSVTDNGSPANTYTLCSACTIVNTTVIATTQVWYVLSSNSGAASTITFTRSSGTLSGSSGCYVAEYSYTGTSVSVDTSGAGATSTPATSIGGVTLTLTGANDVIVQGILAGNVPDAVTSPYTSPTLFPSGTNSGFAGSINTADGTGPTWTLASSARAVVTAIAFKEASGGGVVRHRAWVIQQ